MDGQISARVGRRDLVLLWIVKRFGAQRQGIVPAVSPDHAGERRTAGAEGSIGTEDTQAGWSAATGKSKPAVSPDQAASGAQQEQNDLSDRKQLRIESNLGRVGAQRQGRVDPP